MAQEDWGMIGTFGCSERQSTHAVCPIHVCFVTRNATAPSQRCGYVGETPVSEFPTLPATGQLRLADHIPCTACRDAKAALWNRITLDKNNKA